MKLSLAIAIVAAFVPVAAENRVLLRDRTRKPRATRKERRCGKPNYGKDIPEGYQPRNSLQALLEHGAITKIPASLCSGPNPKKNVILVVGDGMGWEMVRAGAIAKRILDELTGMGIDTKNGSTGAVADAAKAKFSGRKLSDYYTEGKGSGMSFQTLEKFTLVETSTPIVGLPTPGNHYGPARSMMGDVGTHEDGMAPYLLDQCSSKPIDFDPRDFESEGGNMVLWDDVKGGMYPWDANYYSYGTTPTSPGFDPEFIMRHATDSANTAGSMATGYKAAVNMLSVDMNEVSHPTIIEDAMQCGKSGGAISSVPILHATPGAFITHSNSRTNRRQLQAGFVRVNPTYAMGTCAGIYGPSEEHKTQMRSGALNSQWILLEQSAAVNATNFYDRIQNADPDNGTHVLACFGGNYSPSKQDNLPYRGLDGNYQDRYCSAGKTIVVNGTITGVQATTSSNLCDHYTADELRQIPPMNVHVREALKFLGKDDQGFFLMYEQGDIDWAAHGNHMDDMLGTMLDMHDGVDEILNFVANNGGWEKNALYVTADHDHYLTLLPNFPEIVANFIINGKTAEITPQSNSNVNPWSVGTNAGAHLTPGLSVTDALKKYATWSAQDMINVGHFWGPYGSGGNGWGSHSTRPVPLYYQGDSGCIEKFIGKYYDVLGKNVTVSPGKIDQTHIHACMMKTLFGL